MRGRRIRRWLTIAFGAVALLLVGIVAVLHTGLGKAWVADFAARLLSDRDMRAEIGTIEGSIFSRFTIDRIAIADKDGVWLVAERVSVDWSPLSLASGGIDIGAVEIGRIAVARQPVPTEPAPDRKEAADASLPTLTVGRLLVGELDLGKPVLGSPARLRVEGSARLEGPSGAFSASANARRIDETRGSMRAEASYVPASRNLSISADVEEESGGLVSSLSNIGEPLPIKLVLRGSGPLSAWKGHLDLNSGNDALLRGTVTIAEQGDGHRLTMDLRAGGERLLPKPYAEILAGGATAHATLTVSPRRGLEIERAAIVAAGARIDIRGNIQPRLDTVAIQYELQSTDAGAARLVAPDIAWRSLRLTGSVEGKTANPAIKAALTVDALVLRGNRIPTVTLEAQARPVPSGRGDQRLALNLTGEIAAGEAADPRFAKLLAQAIRLNGTATVDAAGDVKIDALSLDLGRGRARFAGTVSSAAARGQLTLDRFDLAALVGVVGLPLAGEASLTADVAGDTQGNLAVSARGGISGPAIGMPALDGLLGARLEISGAMRRAADGALSLDTVALRGDHLAVTASGSAAQAAAKIDARAEINDLAKADARLTGRATIDATLSGSLERPDAALSIEIPEATALGRKIERVSVNATISDFTGNATGTLKIGGTLDGKPIAGNADIATDADGARTLRDLDITVGTAKFTGRVGVSPRNRLAGRIDVDVPDLADLSALVLTELRGRLKAGIVLSVAPSGAQNVELDLDGANIAANGVRVDALHWRGALAVGTDTPSVDTTLDIRGARSGANTVSAARVTAKGAFDDLRMRVDATANGAVSALVVHFAMQPAAPQMRIESFTVRRNGRDLRLAAPARIRFEADAVQIERILLRSGVGSITVEGRVADALDIRVALAAFPLETLTVASPGLNLSGVASGTIRVAGSAAAPTAEYDLSLSQLRNAASQALGAGPFALKARGTANAARLQVAATLTGPNLASAAIDGTVPLAPAGALALTIKGRLDLAAVNPLLAIRGARVSGTVNVDVALAGPMAAPRMRGTLRLSGGRVEDAVSGFYLDRVELSATGTNDALTIDRWSAVARNGGTVGGEGRVELDPRAGLSGRLTLRAQNALLVANETVNAVTDARLEISGALDRRPRIAGRIDIRSLEVTIPDRVPAAAAMIDVRHVNVPARLRPQLPPRAKPVAAGRPGFIADLDLEIAAPVRVYVRGRGVDAELGGTLSLRGTSQQAIVAGGFDLKRGRLDLFGKALNFTRGRMTFPGTLDPALDFVASTTADDVVATVTVAGNASDPKFVFGSTPSLPQDEVLSRLFFGRPSSRLTTGQAIQLAQAAAQLSGAGGPGVLDRVRKRLGVDTLDVGAGPQGKTPQIGVGRRIDDRVFLGVRQGTTPGSSRATVDIDITRNIKIQGEAGTNGSTSIGVGAEWNY